MIKQDETVWTGVLAEDRRVVFVADGSGTRGVSQISWW
jgi:hypothetical protein